MRSNLPDVLLAALIAGALACGGGDPAQTGAGEPATAAPVTTDQPPADADAGAAAAPPPTLGSAPAAACVNDDDCYTTCSTGTGRGLLYACVTATSLGSGFSNACAWMTATTTTIPTGDRGGALSTGKGLAWIRCQ